MAPHCCIFMLLEVRSDTFPGEVTLLSRGFELREECGCSMDCLRPEISHGCNLASSYQERCSGSLPGPKILITPTLSELLPLSTSAGLGYGIPAPSDIPCPLVGGRRGHRRLMRRRPHSLPHTPLMAANARDVEDRKRAMPRWTRCISRETSSATAGRLSSRWVRAGVPLD